mmetsp:Transcript_2189/g.3264  ORF Transcript_2189/g.3264 Transcript_2189/m.3264 type:complete len:246 (+) Transcript_2189:4340-5077(+)
MNVEARARDVVHVFRRSHAGLLQDGDATDPSLADVRVEVGHGDPYTSDHVADAVVHHEHFDYTVPLHVIALEVVEHFQEGKNLNQAKQTQANDDWQGLVILHHLHPQAEGYGSNEGAQDLDFYESEAFEELIFVVHQSLLDFILTVWDVASSHLKVVQVALPVVNVKDVEHHSADLHDEVRSLESDPVSELQRGEDQVVNAHDQNRPLHEITHRARLPEAVSYQVLVPPVVSLDFEMVLDCSGLQ